jgi:hypothetical protein
MAERIDRMTRVKTDGWTPADEDEFRSRLPSSRERDVGRKLPDPDQLRTWAEKVKQGDQTVMHLVLRDWKRWQQLLLDMTALQGRNRPSSARNMMRDMARGKLPRRAKETGDAEFEQWAATQSFDHPQTHNKVKFKSLPADEQARIRQQWAQRKQQAEGQAQQQRPQEEAKEKPSPREEEKGKGSPKKEEQPAGQQAQERAFDQWLGDQDTETIERWRSGKPDSTKEISEKFEEEYGRAAPHTEQQGKEREDKEFKQWLEGQGADAQEAWSGDDRDKRVDVRQKFRAERETKKKEKEEKKAPKTPRREEKTTREEFFSTPKEERHKGWTQSTDGNRFTETADVSTGATVKQSQISGAVKNEASVDDSHIHGTVEGSAKVERSTIERGAIVSDAAKISGATIEFGARVRGDTEISDARIAGGSWDGQKIKNGRGGTFHQAWDQDTLDILTSIKPQVGDAGHRSTAPGVGDGPLLSMVHYLEDGGRTKGMLGGKIDPKKLRERIKQHIFENYDRKDPWLGRGASHIGELSDDDFDKLMEVAQREADKRKAESARKKKAMLYVLAKQALEQPELRPALSPLIRLSRDLRVASGERDFRAAAIRFAYASPDRRVRVAVVKAVRAGDSIRGEMPRRAPDMERLNLLPEQYRGLVRIAYETTNPSRRRRILAMLRQAEYGGAFVKWVEKQTFKHPETGNDVKFVSLPKAEQAVIHDQWAQGKVEWAQKFKPEGLSKETELTPAKFDKLKPDEMLWISWSPAKFHKVTGFGETKSGKPVLEMVQVDPETGREGEVRYLHRTSAGDPKHEIHIVPQSEKKPKELPMPSEVWKEMRESGLLETLIPEGARRMMHTTTSHSRGDHISVTSELSGATGDFTVIGKYTIRGDDGTEYLLVLGEAGPTVVPVAGPTAKGIQVKTTGKAEGTEDAEETVPNTQEILNKTKPEGLPSDESSESLGLAFRNILDDWEGSPNDFELIETLGKKHYGDKFDQNVHKKLLGWVADSLSDVAEMLREEGDESDADYWQSMHDDVQEKVKHVLGKHKDRKELLGKPKKKGDAETKVHSTQYLVDLAAPEAMDPEVRKKTQDRMFDLRLGTAQKLFEHLSAALKNPDGAYSRGLLESGYTTEGIRELHWELGHLVRPYAERKYTQPVLEVANQYDLESEDADALYDFKVDKPSTGFRINETQLMQKFLAKAKPETRERMKGMSLADFMVMYKSIMKDEEEGAAEAA